jgi:TP901 family phage tail tape measure protein
VAEVVKTIVDIEINTGNAASQLKALQQQINAFNLAINKGNTFQTAAVAKYTSELKDVINSSRFFTAETVRMSTAAKTLDNTLKKGQSTLGNFFSARFNKNSALFAETMSLAAERARTLQTQFVAMSGSAKGMQEALAIRPLAAFNSELSIATQRSQILSSMFRQGTTHLINFGKNVQWAGRQLMVGFTLPLTSFGMVAGRTFADLEKQLVSFKKVYGDIFTTPAELQGNLDAVMALGKEYTKYGIAVKDTVGLAAQAAAAGRRNKDLTDAVSEATRLSTLGQIDQNEALKTTIALQSAFKLSGEDLTEAINFLNIVENQTVVSLQDLSAAIPRVAPVIVGLGGDVKDLAVFLAAMQEGGVSAEQGANALKSGLGSLINPTREAKDMLAGFNINLQGIVDANRGDLMGTVMAVSKALSTLDEFSRQQALETIFGKYQYARLGALFDNITRQGSQAQQVIDTMAFSTEQMAQSADRELKTIEESFGVQLRAAVEQFKLAIAPIGQMFLQMAIPVVNFFTKIVEGFNNLPDFAKRFAAFATIITGLLIPAGTMFFGLLMNLSGTLAKLLQSVGIFTKGALKGGIVGGIQAVTQSMKYMSLEELDSAIAARQLGNATMTVNDALRQQILAAEGAQVAINDLASVYSHLINRMAEAAAISKFTLGAPGAAMQMAKTRNIKGGFPQKFASGGLVPGSGNKDTVPAMLTPGEFVVKKDVTSSIGVDFLRRLNGGTVNKYQNGGSAFDRFAAQQMESGNRYQDIVRGTFSGGTGTYTERLLPGTQNLLSNAVYAVEPKYNQAFNGEKRFAGGYGVPVGSIKSILSSKGRVYNPYAYLDEYSRRTGIVYNKQQHASALISQIQEMASKAKPGQKVRIVDGASAMAKAMSKDPSAFYIRLDEVFQSNRVQSSLPNSLLDVLKTTSTARGKEKLKGTGIIKPANTKPLSQRQQQALGQLFVPSYMGLRQSKSNSNIVAAMQRNLAKRGIKFQAAHFFADGGTVPSLLTPGEFVVNKNAAEKNRGFLQALNSGMISKFQDGGDVATQQATGTRSAFRNVVGRVGAFGGAASIAGATGLMVAGPLLAQSSNAFASSIGNFINSMQPAIFGLSMVAPYFPKLAKALGGPVGVGVVAGIAALGITTYKVIQQMNQMRDSGAALTRAMYGSSKSVENIASAFGVKTATQQVTSILSQRVGGAVSTQTQQESDQFIQTDAGKQILADLERVKSSGGDTIVALRNQLTRSIMAGVLTPEQARGVAISIGNALNDQNLAIDVSAQIRQLVGVNGELIQGNRIKILGEITPKINLEEVRATAEQQYAQQTSGFFGKIGALFTEKDAEINRISLATISEQTQQAMKIQAESVDMAKLAVIEGRMSLEEYNLEVERLARITSGAAVQGLDALAKQLGVTKGELNNIANQKQFYGGGKGGGVVAASPQASLLQGELTKMKAAAQSTLESMGLDKVMINKIAEGISSENFTEQFELLGAISGNALTDEMEIRLAKMLGKGKYYFDNLLKTQLRGGTEVEYKDPNDIASLEGEKSKIQLLLESIKLTMDQTKAVQYLIKNGLEPEAALTVDAATAVEIMNKKRSDLVDKIRDQATAQRMLAIMGLSQEQKSINILQMKNQEIDLNISQVQRQIDQINRLNQLDERQAAVRQRGLDQIGKQEKIVNDQYGVRLDALDKISKSEDRLAQQRQSQITLASALTGGDFAAAAVAASQMSAQFASYQLEDARTSLESQRDRELEAITVSINGQMMTRKQIESEIDVINERIYQRNQQTVELEDKIFNYNQQKQANMLSIDSLQLEITKKQLQQEASLAKSVGSAKSLRDYYAEILSIMQRMPSSRATGKMYGGVIQRFMYGGMPKGSKERPPSLKMATGSIVPGMGITDKVPALLTPGEFVVRKSVAKANMPLLKSLNSNIFPSDITSGSNIAPIQSNQSISNISSPVYNYSVNVNVADTNASAGEIADVVIGKIRTIQDRQIRGNRY